MALSTGRRKAATSRPLAVWESLRAPAELQPQEA